MQWALMSLLVQIATLWTRPQRATCPVGWWVNGVRPDGVYECLRAPLGLADDAPTPDGWVLGRVFCGPRRALVLDARTVACQGRADPS